MRDIIKRILKEYDNPIQKINFDGFSDPILIPQYNMYIVKFLGTGKYDKISDIEKISFKGNDGKEYLFNADDIQKTGSSPFYIKLDTLRRYYDIRFDDDFERQKVKLNRQEFDSFLTKTVTSYVSKGRCKNDKCKELRITIEDSLKDIYGENYGTYSPISCKPITGFMNIYPIGDVKDVNGNTWSKLNYIPFKENSVKTILVKYLKEFGTFEHEDFLTWIRDEKYNLFKGEFLELMVRNLGISYLDKLFDNSILKTINKKFPNFKIVDSFCPSGFRYLSNLMVINYEGRVITIQPIFTKNTRVLKHNNEYYIFFGSTSGSPDINMKADYFVIPNGAIFKNSNVIRGKRSWKFSDPPIFYDSDYDLELKYRHKIF